ncbi:MAG: gas vesicle protein [Chloroflexi bacterium]|nr:gas vesicle protein [Chloroflexota bacterium]
MNMNMNISEVGKEAAEELAKLTGLDPSTLVSISKKDENEWKVVVEMVERHGIPDSSDILGIYEILTDNEGKLLSFCRSGMRRRMDMVGGEDE